MSTANPLIPPADPNTLGESGYNPDEDELFKHFEAQEQELKDSDNKVDLDGDGQPIESGDPGTDVNVDEAGPSDSTAPVPGTQPDDTAVLDDDDDDPDSEEENSPAPVLTYGDRNFSSEDVQRLVALDNWADQTFYRTAPTGEKILDENAVNAVEMLFSGQYQLVPIGQTLPTPTPDNKPDDGKNLFGVDPEVLEDLDPGVVQILQRQQEELQQLKSYTQQSILTQQQSAQQQQAEQIRSAHAEVQEQYNLTPDESQLLLNNMVQLQILGGFVNQNQGDVRAGAKAALEAVMYSNPTFREKAMKLQMANSAGNNNGDVGQKVKARKASALSGGGGSVTRQSNEPPKSREAQIADEFRKAMEQ